MFIHIVGPGDSLFSIGRRYGASVDQIRSVNGLDETNIVPGQALLICIYSPAERYAYRHCSQSVCAIRATASGQFGHQPKCFTSGSKNNDSFDLKLHCGDIEFLCAPES